MAKGKYLNRQHYINAALELIDDVGVGKLSIRKLASHLGVSAMAPYKHFANKEELLVCALEEFISRSNVYPDDSLTWDQWVQEFGEGMYTALCGEASWIPLLGSIRIGLGGLAVIDSITNKLTAAGFSTTDAVEAYFVLIHLVIGAASIQSNLDHPGQLQPADSGSVAHHEVRTVERIDTDTLRAVETVINKRQIDIGLPVLIGALRNKLEAGPHGEKKANR